jgi:hypothetical protein
MDQTQGVPDGDRDRPRPEHTPEAFPALDTLLPWETSAEQECPAHQDLCEAPPPPPDLPAAPGPDPSAVLPWEPADLVEESPSPFAPDGELPAWLKPEGVEAALDGTNGTLLSLSQLESLTKAELGPPDGPTDGDNPAGRTFREPTRDQPTADGFDSSATVLRLTIRTLPRPESHDTDTPPPD